MESVDAGQIVSGLRALGIGEGDLLLAHLSLRSFGHVIGGADAVARALVTVVGERGTVFVPTFNFGELPYDPRTTPSLTGAVTEAFRHLPGAIRSDHPTHSIAGIGPAAGEILAGHEHVHAFSRRSPLWRLWERNAWVLLIGCGHESNSMVHVAEELFAVAYVDRARTARVIEPDGAVREIVVRRPGCSNHFHAIDGPLMSRGAMREATIGQASLKLMRAADIVCVASAMLKEDPAALLCEMGSCRVCDEARRMLARM